MRKIKFRAWDKEAKEMIYDFSLSSVDHGKRFLLFPREDPDEKLEKALCEYDKTGYFSLIDYSNFYFQQCLVMQFIGLLDKNGKEIFEGDIVEGTHGVKAIIEWTQEFGRWSMHWSDGSTTPISWHVKHAIVIGNIHETEELVQ